jgi:RHS repeat-associated protein
VDSDRTFDAVGNRILGSEGLLPDAGGIYRRTFDADRNLSALELQQADLVTSDSETITLDYRSDRQRTAVHRGFGADHEFLYDTLGRPIERRERVDGSWSVMTYAYDAAGRPVSTDLPNGTRQEQTWGPDGRNSGHRALRDGAVESAATLTWAAGRLASAHDSTTGLTEVYGYDASGRLASRQFGDGDELQLGYDLRSRLSAEVFLANGALTTWLLYGYALADRRTRTQDTSGDLVVRTYTDGRLSQAAYGNGVTRSFSYGPSGGLAGSTSVDAAGTTIEATTVELDTPTWISHKASTTTFGGVAQTTVEDYWLLPLPTAGTPTSFAGKSVAGDADPSGTPVNVYGYDARSNLASKASVSFAYNTERNRLLSKSDATTGAVLRSYTYDDAGYVTDRGGVPLTWSAQGLLLSYGSNTLVRDAFGRVRASTIEGVSTTTRWGGRIVGDASGLPLSLDLHEVKLDLAGGGHLYRHLDFRGNVKFTTDDTGVVRSHYRYTAYGLDHVHGLDEDGTRFATRPEIGDLMLMGARVYDPDVARFLSPDPVFQIVNQFAYTLSNPVWFHDRSGMEGATNSSAEGVASGLDLAGHSAGFVGAAMVAGTFVAAPLTVVAGGAALLLLSASLFLTAELVRAFGETAHQGGLVVHGGSSTVTTGGTGGGGIGGGLGGDGGGGGSGGGTLCSPAGLTALPDASRWLWVLLPLQLLLGLAVLRRRRW